jgi:glycosyltransferase involved in cell wall biosynthesis
VLASSWEAFPIGALEALASGVPQVATDVGGTAEAVTAETGVLVPPRDPAALAEAVIALLRDPERRARMSAASRARHADRFGVERMVARTAALYGELLERR